MLDFRPISITDKEAYESRLQDGRRRGCEFGFGNIFLWGDQKIAYYDGQIIMLGTFGSWICYYYPLGDGDKKGAIEAIILDAKERKIPCRINSVYEEDKELLMKCFPGRFNIIKNRNSFDYLYFIENLSDLSGKKYHGKRNHISQFKKAYPNYKVYEASRGDITKIREMTEDWYKRRQENDPEGDYKTERDALNRALDSFPIDGFESLVLENEGEILGFTMGSLLSPDTFDVNFEKARADINGAYTVINNEFACLIRQKYPNVVYIDREEDMGIEGLRRAKMSYHPNRMIEKYRAEYIGD